MTIKPGLTALAVASSAVLIFGNTAHAKVPSLLGSAPIYGTVGQMTDPTMSMEFTSNEPVIETSPLPPKLKPRAAMSSIKEKSPAAEDIVATMGHTVASTPTGSTGNRYVASNAGNTYACGQCTWYAKSKRPDLPNRLGNGGQWVASAAALGFATGSTPRAGAIGEQPGHVVYVESVNKNGTVNISEMNYNGGVGVVNHRTVPASTFKYIY